MDRDVTELLAATGQPSCALEVGIGERPDLARRLATAGVEVWALDIQTVPVPEDVRFVQMDVTASSIDLFPEVELVYARRLPPELHHSAKRLAIELAATLAFTTIGGEWPAIPTTPLTIGRDTWYRFQPSE